MAGSTATVSGLTLTADRTEGRRRRLSTVVVERDPSAIPTDDNVAVPGAAANGASVVAGSSPVVSSSKTESTVE